MQRHVVSGLAGSFVQVSVTMRTQVVDILVGDDADVLVARFNDPVKVQAVEAADSVILRIVRDHLKVQVVARVDLAEVRAKLDPLNLCHSNLRCEHLSRAYTQNYWLLLAMLILDLL